MKASILSAAALLATGAVAADIGFYGDPGCNPIHKFNFAEVPNDFSCKTFNAPIFGAQGVILTDCEGPSQCLCTVYVSSNCDANGSWVQVLNENGQIDCPTVTGFVFSSARCQNL